VDQTIGALEAFRQLLDVREVIGDELRAKLDQVLSSSPVADERDDLVATLAKPLNDRMTDEPGAAGDDDPDRLSLSRSRFPDQLTRATP
jgi:hypothetical protein